MVILRHSPGENAPWDGLYVLVGHYGESTDLAVWCDKGERLPRIVTTADIGPLWFVRQDEANQRPRAA